MSSPGAQQIDYQTRHGILVKRSTVEINYKNAVESLTNDLDSQKGALFASNFEYPGRYTRWSVGFKNPCLEIIANDNLFTITTLNSRGKILLPAIMNHLDHHLEISEKNTNQIQGYIKRTNTQFTEEQRSKQPSIFSLVRQIIDLFYSQEDSFLGLYGAFGYDLVFQFEEMEKKLNRDPTQRDMVLYFPDEIYIVDHQQQNAIIHSYDFTIQQNTTEGLAREGCVTPYVLAKESMKNRDHAPGEYAALVEKAKRAFKKGDLFEVVPGQLFYETCDNLPSEIFRRLRERNPSPYGFLINLGDNEFLVGASPEMYVKVTGSRVETSPISGTIARGKNAMGDAEQIFKLLSSKKDESELTMCTDVDRNDKSRICEPGSVRVIGRRLIEMYSRLIHTVDHVEGMLRPEYDALDAFLTHMWVVTVTGAPKQWAMQFIENNERTPRRWYAGAIGWINFDGNMNTGLTLRTIRLTKGIAEIRVGATLLYDSNPEEEEKETELKAAALFDAIRRPIEQSTQAFCQQKQLGINKTILLVDHQDSFVHTLANYLRQTGAKVVTIRSALIASKLTELKPDLIVLSPGPGCPDDFKLKETIALAIAKNIPIFGVCLGLQGIVEYFGGRLGVLDYPMHGKPMEISHKGGKLFKNFPEHFRVGLYHSLYALNQFMPPELTISAISKQGVIMAIEHQSLPIWAVQFHPESIMSLEGNYGLELIFNMMELVS